MNKTFSNSRQSKDDGISLPAEEIMKSWWNAAFNFNSRQVAARKILAAGLEQQKICSRLTTSLFACTEKTIKAIRNGAKSGRTSEEAMKIYKDWAADYNLACTDFVESECSLFCTTLRAQEPGEAKSENAETVKSKTKETVSLTKTDHTAVREN